MRLTKISFFIMVMVLFVFPKTSFSQVVIPSGTATEASGQLIYVFGSADSPETLHITNTNDTVGIWIHVQVFINEDTDADLIFDRICDERDFVDFLTPNDTHAYITDNLVSNIGETSAPTPGNFVPVGLAADEFGFVVITPVVSDVDFTAISFPHLTGNINSGFFTSWTNTMGRNAVDYATAEVLADGTPLDGITNGFELLQPSQLSVNVEDDNANETTAFITVVFEDSYGPAGLLGYAVLPGTATLTSFVFDFIENPTSCGNVTIDCFNIYGIEEDDFNSILGDGAPLLCGGTDIPANANGDQYGWIRSFVSGLGNSNFLVAFGTDTASDSEDLVWAYTK